MQDNWLVLDKLFRTAVEHPIALNFRNHADVCYLFEQGDQWFADEKATLKARNQPAIVENEIRPTIERLLGQFRRQHTTIKFIGRNVQDDQLAQAQSDLLKHIDYINHYEFTEARVVRDKLICGMGVLEAIVKENELGQPQVRYRWEDPFTIFMDPYSRSYDWNEDARYICRAKWLYEEEAKLLWPDKAVQIEECVRSSVPSPTVLTTLDPTVLQNRNWWNLYYDQNHRRFRPVEIWYKKRATQRTVTLPDGKKVVIQSLSKKALKDALEELPGSTIEDKSIDQMWAVVYCGGIILDGPKPSPYRCNKFPFVPYWAYRKADGEPQGYVWNLIDPQREVNARRTKALWALNNRQTIFERNTVRDKHELAEEMARMDGQIELEPGKFDRFKVQENQDISQGNLAMLQEAKLSIKHIAGEDQVNPAPEVRSARGLQRIEASQQNNVLTLFDNIRHSRRLKASLTYEYIQQFYTDEMVFQITEDPNVVRTVRISESQFDTIKNEIYDIVATDTQDYLNTRNEQLDMLMTTLPQILQFGPQWASLLIQMSDLRDKQGLLQHIQQMSQPPPVMPKLTVNMQWGDMATEEKAAWAMLWQKPELAKVLMAIKQLPNPVIKALEGLAKTELKTQADIQKAQIAHHAERMGHQNALEVEALRGLGQMQQTRLEAQLEPQEESGGEGA